MLFGSAMGVVQQGRRQSIDQGKAAFGQKRFLNSLIQVMLVVRILLLMGKRVTPKQHTFKATKPFCTGDIEAPPSASG